ncbi:MAG: acyltransferase [Bradyrhizobiaceae bacterium]|nr:MAG: acyltransferase [Bradyrhizobiaceae bacterium]
MITANGTYAADRPALLGSAAQFAPERIDWVDYAKGICIIMVVMMHSVLGTELAAERTGYMHHLVEFAKPFRMPDFFLISGLFLARVIDRNWRTYLDRKVVHFLYFYALWVTIQFGFKAPGIAAEQGWTYVGQLYLMSFIEPFGTLWFIYMLPVFFVLTKATRNLPPLAIWTVAALLEMAPIATGWTMIDEFCARFVYFYSGYLFATQVFALSDRARARPVLALLGLAAWALINAVLVYGGLSELPVLSLVLGFAGAVAIIVGGTLLAKMQWLTFLRFCGEHSIVIYLAFFLPMAITRTALLSFTPLDIGTVSLLVTISGIVGALIMWRLALLMRANFLFERPAAFWIAPKAQRADLQAAE